MFRKIVSPVSSWKLRQPVRWAKASTVDAGEVEKFSELADSWWDANGKMKALHAMNAVRVPFIVEGLNAASGSQSLRDLALLDVGCGAGILTERLARETGASCTGLDPSAALVATARKHAELDGRLANLRYACSTVEEEVAGAPGAYDAVVASEVVEHVDDYRAFVATCCAAVKVGGSVVFTTINRTLASRVWAIWAAEYVWDAIPRGTHEWRKFVTPQELAECLEENGEFCANSQWRKILAATLIRCTKNFMEFCVAFRPLHRVWQVFGLAPISEVYCTGRKISCKKYSKVSGFWFLTIAVITVCVWYRNIALYLTISELIMLTYVAIDMLSAAKFLLTLGICYYSDMQQLLRYDQQLRYADVHLVGESNGKGKLLGGLVLTVSGAAAIAVVATVDPHRNGLLQYSTVAFLLAFDTLVTLQFVLLVLELRARFRCLNKSLQEGFPAAIQRPPLGAVWPAPEPGKLRQLLGAYLALSRAADCLQAHFGLPVAFSVAHSLCCATASAYELLLLQMRSHWVSRLPLSPTPAHSAMWLVHHWVNISAMALSCAALKDAASTTGDVLLRSSVLCERRCSELEAFLRLTTFGQPLSFSAAGFFTVDRPMLVSALAVVVTYLVILGQLTPK